MQQKMKTKKIIVFTTLIIAALLAALLFITWGLNTKNIDYNLPRRLKKLAAIVITGSGIAVASLIFQTVTNNHILTPGVMGMDSLYLFMQTIVVYFFGSKTLTMTSDYTEFAISCILMVGFSLVLFTLIFRRPGQNLFVMILAGMVCGSFFSSLSSFMQTMIDPNEYLILQGKMFASFNNVNTSLLAVSAVIIGASLCYILLTHKKLDVLSLGRENAINLGINYNPNVLFYLVLVSLIIAVSTALIGPITFLGVLVVNLSRELLKTYRHIQLAIGACLVSIIALVGGQFFVERVFQFDTTVSVLVNFIGGIYFIFLLLKERRA